MEVVDGGVLVGGASDAATVHDDVWRYRPATDTWDTLPSFPGGPRRGGCIASWGGVRVLYGTGSDNVQRYTDWYSLEVPVGLEERTTGRLSLHPVPCEDHVLLTGITRNTPAIIIDAMGRTVLRTIARPGGPMDLGTLGPGRYILVTVGGMSTPRRHLPFVKLP
jgi:hypothetical protein